MTVAGYPSGYAYGCNDDDTNNDRRRARQSSSIGEKSTLPAAMVCPLHGGGYMDRRRAPPPPPPQLAAVGRRRCRSRNAAISQPHERRQPARDDPPNNYCPASESFTNDCYYFTDERPFPLGYGWVEPGKGWTRSHRPTSCVPPEAPQNVKKSAALGIDTSRDWFNKPSARDTAWAMSYLSREDGMQRQHILWRHAAREHAGRRGYHHAPKTVPPRGKNGSAASRQPSATYLTETHIMQHKLDSARIYNKGLRVSNSELARQVVALRRKVEAIARPPGTAPIRQSTCGGATERKAQGRESVADTSLGKHSMKMKTDTAKRDDKAGASPQAFRHSRGGNVQWDGRCRREPEGADVEQKQRSPREERKSRRAPPEAKQTQTLTHIGTEAEMTMAMKPRNRSEAHTETQTEAACPMGEGGDKPAPGWQGSDKQENGRVVYNEEARTSVTTVCNSRPEGGEVVGETGAVAVAGSRLSSERADQMGHHHHHRRHRLDTEPLASAGGDEKPGQEYSCESSEPEGRPNRGAEPAFEERTPRAYYGCSKASVAQRPEVASSTAEVVPPTTQEPSDTLTTVDEKRKKNEKEKEMVSSKKEESHRKQGKQGNQGNQGPRHDREDSGVGIGGSVDVDADTGLSQALTCVSGAVAARRGDELEGCSETWTGETRIVVECHTPPPLSLGRSDSQASRRPVPLDEMFRASPTEKKIVEEEQMPSRDVTRQTGEAEHSHCHRHSHSNREDEKWTETTTETGKVDVTPQKEVQDLEEKLHRTARTLAAFKIAFIVARYSSPIDRHAHPPGRFAALPTGVPWVALALSRWRSLGGLEWSRRLGSRTSRIPSTSTAGAGSSRDASIEGPTLTATTAPAATGLSLERSSDGYGRENDFLANKVRDGDRDRDGTVQRESSEGSHLTEAGMGMSIPSAFPPMPPIPIPIPPAPAPAPRPRTVEAGTALGMPAAAWDELEQDGSVREGVSLSLLPNHCGAALIATTAHGPPLKHNDVSKEGEQPRNGSWRPAGEVEFQDDLEITGFRLGSILVPPPFLSPVKEEEEQEAEEQAQEHQEEQRQTQDEQEQNAPPPESKEWGDDEVGDHRDRETNIVRTMVDILPSEGTAMLAGGAQTTPFVEEVVDERVAARSDEQGPEEAKEREEGLTGHREEEEERHHAPYIADREEEADACFLVPTNDDATLKNHQEEVGDVEKSGGEQRHASSSSSSSSSSPSSTCTTADNREANERFCRRDAVPQRGREAEGLSGRGEAPRTGVADREGVDREEKESDSSYRRDCAVLAGTAKIVFAMLALQHRGVSSRFYRWKRTRHRLQKDRSSIVRATGGNPLPHERGR